MKSILLILSVVLFFSFTSQKDHSNYNSEADIQPNFKSLDLPAPPSFEQLVKNQTKKDDKEIDQAWYSKAIENIQKEEYNISYSEELNSYQSPNRKNNMRFIFHKDGFTAKNRQTRIPLFDINDKTIKEEDKKYETVPEWSIDFKMSNVNRQTSVVRRETQEAIHEIQEIHLTNSPYSTYSTAFNSSELKVSGNKASIKDDNMRIDYTNDEVGMRQDFIIMIRPKGEGKLRLNLSADTKLKMIVGADALMFKDNKGNEKMKYSALKCWDANGRELRAYFENQLQMTNDKLQIKKNTSKIKKNLKSFAIVVNDEDAVYPITIDPLSTTPSWIAESNLAAARFGFSVSTAGDVDGNGYSDIIIGAYTYDINQSARGKVFVYYGFVSGLQLTPWSVESDKDYAFFGNSVATAGDVNGDGYSDVIVGAYLYANLEPEEGKVFVYYGSPSGLSPTANWTIESNQAYSRLGISVSTAGDVNDDGYCDVIVGAYQYDNGETNEGRAYLYYGSEAGLSGSLSWIESNQPNAFFGTSVSTAGDVNGDGYSDVIIGASGYSNGNISEGRAFVYHGSASGLNLSSSWTAESNQDVAFLGFSVSTAGDVNGDGYSDVIVGAYRFNTSFSEEGKAYVYYGSSAGLAGSPNWTAVGNQNGANFGYSVSTAGDVNGDGFSDVIVGAYTYSNPQTYEGRAFVYEGSTSGLSATANWTAEGNQVDANFGTSVSTAGDINGDGYSDIIVGAPNFDNGQTNEGRVNVYYGFSSGLSANANWTSESNQPNAYFGNSVSSAGDVNGDGYSDIIVGAYNYDNGQNDEGRSFVFHGSSSGLSIVADWTAEINQANSWFGWSVSSAGDVNGDGFSDVIIGAHLSFNGQNQEGRAFVYHGSASGLSLSANWTAESNQAMAFFGYSVSTAGDVNGDGFSDVIVGAYSYSNGQNQEGRSFVYHGSSTGLSLAANWTSESNQQASSFGWSVSSAGDVNGDGFSDVIVGAYLYDNSQTDEGRAFVYHGSPAGLLATASWTGESDLNNSYFGHSVSNAGDINGDSFSDVIVGAPYYSNGQNREGKVYVYHGSPTGLSPTISWSAESDRVDAYFGWCVSKAGDVNGDGFSDVIVGSVRYDNGQFGRVFVYFGSESGLSVANWTTGSNQENDNFGWSVASAGDVNGDGYSDVIVGAYTNDNGQNNEGKVFVYYDFGFNLLFKGFIEGFYDPATNTTIRDTIKIYLRYAISPFDLVDSSKSLVSSSGDAKFRFSNVRSGRNYYIVIRHRNSLETWSSTAHIFTLNSLNYNFSTAAAQSFGNNMMQIDAAPVVFGIYSGDVNQEGYIDLTDVILVYNDASNFVTGYNKTDINGDYITDLTDMIITYNNSNSFVSVRKP